MDELKKEAELQIIPVSGIPQTQRVLQSLTNFPGKKEVMVGENPNMIKFVIFSEKGSIVILAIEQNPIPPECIEMISEYVAGIKERKI